MSSPAAQVRMLRPILLSSLASVVLVVSTAVPAGATQADPAPSTTTNPQEVSSQESAETADRDEPSSEPADLQEANERVRAGDYAGAEKILAELQVDHPDDPRLLLMRGELLLALGRSTEALEVLDSSAELDAEQPRVHFQLGTARLAAGDRRGAIEAFGREIELNDDPQVLVLSHWNRSMIFERLTQWDDAARELEQALGIQPERSDGFGDLAVIYLRGDRPDDAFDALERGLAAGFRSGQHFYSVGARFFEDERYEDSVAAFSRAIEVDSELASAERSLAASLDKLGRRDEARDHLRRYLALEPDAEDAPSIAERLRAAGGD